MLIGLYPLLLLYSVISNKTEISNNVKIYHHGPSYMGSYSHSMMNPNRFKYKKIQTKIAFSPVTPRTYAVEHVKTSRDFKHPSTMTKANTQAKTS